MSTEAPHAPGDLVPGDLAPGDLAPGDLAGIDPFTCTDDGAYRDAYVEVRAESGPQARRSLHMVRTTHFDVTHDGPRVHLVHRVPRSRIDDDLSGLLADELFTPGWLRGSDLFERLFTGVVLTSGSDPIGAWTHFYATTLQRVAEVLDASPGDGAGNGSGAGVHGTIADYAPVYARAEQLLAPGAGTVLELGCCFGFLSLRLAAAGHSVTATDVDAGTVALLSQVAPRLGVDLTTRVGEASRFPAPDRSSDTVLLIHLLEHLEPDHGERALTEALRLARRRVVVAVPLEDEANETWGHLRTFTLADLADLGRRTGWTHVVLEDHGGWLVLDR